MRRWNAPARPRPPNGLAGERSDYRQGTHVTSNVRLSSTTGHCCRIEEEFQAAVEQLGGHAVASPAALWDALHLKFPSLMKKVCRSVCICIDGSILSNCFAKILPNCKLQMVKWHLRRYREKIRSSSRSEEEQVEDEQEQPQPQPHVTQLQDGQQQQECSPHSLGNAASTSSRSLTTTTTATTTTSSSQLVDFGVHTQTILALERALVLVSQRKFLYRVVSACNRLLLMPLLQLVGAGDCASFGLYACTGSVCVHSSSDELCCRLLRSWRQLLKSMRRMRLMLPAPADRARPPVAARGQVLQ